MNQPVPRRPTGFFRGLWNVLNFFRQLVLNLAFFGCLFLILLIFVIAAVQGGGIQPLQDRTTLVIAPEGRLVEQYTSDPMTRALVRAMGSKRGQEVQLRDLLQAIERAGTDGRIERVFLRVDKLSGGGMASLREVAQALAGLRASGKQIVAFGEGLNQAQYLLAAQANEVYVDPMGGVLMEGLGRYRLYFRQALQDKLGVDVHLFRVGEYKSAAEPYVLDAASPEAKEADLYWMNDLWQRYLDDIAAARSLDRQELAGSIDRFPQELQAVGGDQGQYALQHKLVDGLKTLQEVEDMLAESGVADPDSDNGFRSVSLDGYLFHLNSKRAAMDKRPQVAVVVAEGEISGGEQPPGTVGGESTSALLRSARDDDDVKAVVLRVNSPGGEVFASEQIRREIVGLKEAGKPVVVSMGDLAASGGYWISMNADRIYADPSTISGSIGIFGLLPNITRTLDRIGVHSDGVGTERLAGAFDISKPLDPAAAEVIQSIVDKGYADFTGKVAEARHQSVEAIDAVARGRVWSGSQAKDRGLVDELGGLSQAIAAAAGQAKLGASGKYRIRYIEKDESPFAQFSAGLAGSHMGSAWLRDSGMASLLLARNGIPELDAQLRFVEKAAQRGAGAPVEPLAYCFCGL
ncbi:MAG: signal peptide peptidase SppA [Xanthomonadaceae bacterium]|jgi:protease-4|nr:signal peptide peptidase SppA [Xanthomonadaceae bacterium]